MSDRDEPPPSLPLRPVLGTDPLRLIVIILAIALVTGLPFALKAGAEFFLPLTAALVISIVLVPGLAWLERRGLPSPIASLLCVTGFVLLVNGALALIIVPASDWFIKLPERLPRIRDNLAPLIDAWVSLQRFVDEALQVFASNTAAQAQAIAVQTPGSILDYLALSAPFLTPLVLGRRLTINPLLILVSLSFWGWIWGAPGAFLAVPLLIVIQTIIQSLRHHDA